MDFLGLPLLYIGIEDADKREGWRLSQSISLLKLEHPLLGLAPRDQAVNVLNVSLTNHFESNF